MRKRNWKKQRPRSLAEAFELAAEFATEHGNPPKRMASLMGEEIGTYIRITKLARYTDPFTPPQSLPTMGLV